MNLLKTSAAWAKMRPALAFVWMTLGATSPALATARPQETFNIELFRETVREDAITDSSGAVIHGKTVIGTLYVNQKPIGKFYENDALKIPAGEYSGRLRYRSAKGFVQGPFGAYGKKGDFLIEVENVEKRSNILLHGGTKFIHSEGCILLGPIAKSGGQKYVVDATGPLYTLRKLFYGTDTPTQTPDKKIRIVMNDAKPKSQENTTDQKGFEGKWRVVEFKKEKIVEIKKTGDSYQLTGLLYDFTLKGGDKEITGEHIFTIAELEKDLGKPIPSRFHARLEGKVRANLTLSLVEEGAKIKYRFVGAHWNVKLSTGQVDIKPSPTPQNLTLARIAAP